MEANEHSALKEEQISSEQVLEGKLLQVYRDAVRLPDGSEGMREWIDHMGASAVVPIFENGDTILIRQYRYAVGREFLEVPAGKLDLADQDPKEVAAIELQEETGYSAERFTKLGSGYPCIGYSNEQIHVFLAEGLTKGEMDLDDGEFIETMRVPFAEAVRKARNGELKDMKTVAALTYAANAMDAKLS